MTEAPPTHAVTAGSGLSRTGPADVAAGEAARMALAAAGIERADVAFVFVSGDAWTRGGELLQAVRRATGASAIVGCSGVGVLTERGEVEGEEAAAVMVVRDPRLIATPFLLGDLTELGADAGSRLATAAAEAVLQDGIVIVLPDAHGLEPRSLLGGFDRALGFVPVVGAVAAGAPLCELVNGDVVQGGLGGIALGGAEAVVGVAQGCMPIGEPFIVTGAEGHVVYTIGSRPALRVLKEALDALPDAQARIRRAGVFTGLAMDPAKSPLTRGDFLVRNLLGIDQSSGAIAVGEDVRIGQTIQFQIRDAAAAREDLAVTLESVAERLRGRRPAFGHYFNCAGRGQGLFGAPDHDVTLIRERLGEFPLVGFFGNGEFAPIGTRNFFHTYTGVLAVFC